MDCVSSSVTEVLLFRASQSCHVHWANGTLLIKNVSMSLAFLSFLHAELWKLQPWTRFIPSDGITGSFLQAPIMQFFLLVLGLVWASFTFVSPTRNPRPASPCTSALCGIPRDSKWWFVRADSLRCTSSTEVNRGYIYWPKLFDDCRLAASLLFSFRTASLD